MSEHCEQTYTEVDYMALETLYFGNVISTAPSPIDPVLTVQPDHCYIFFFFKKYV